MWELEIVFQTPPYKSMTLLRETLYRQNPTQRSDKTQGFAPPGGACVELTVPLAEGSLKTVPLVGVILLSPPQPHQTAQSIVESALCDHTPELPGRAPVLPCHLGKLPQRVSQMALCLPYAVSSFLTLVWLVSSYFCLISFLLPVFLGSASHVNYQHPNPCLRICFWDSD